MWNQPPAVMITNCANSLTATCANKSSWFLSVNSPALELTVMVKIEVRVRVKERIRVRVSVSFNKNNLGAVELTDNY